MRSIISNKEELWIIIKYGLVGVLNTFVFSSSVYIFSRTGIDYTFYTLIAYLIAISFSFIMNLRFTFVKFSGSVFPRLIKFLSVSISLMILAEIVQYVLIEYFNLVELFGVVFGMIIYTILGFLINRLWVFK